MDLWEGLALAASCWKISYEMQRQAHEEAGGDLYLLARTGEHWQVVPRALLLSQQPEYRERRPQMDRPPSYTLGLMRYSSKAEGRCGKLENGAESLRRRGVPVRPAMLIPQGRDRHMPA